MSQEQICALSEEDICGVKTTLKEAIRVGPPNK